jgi:ubiquinone/menaquinone biosynthesis C-methylase UbiE
MKREFVSTLRCLVCGAGQWEIFASREDEREIREGKIVCGCGAEAPIRSGVIDFLDPNDEKLRREVHGWIELAGPLGEHLVPTMVALPYYPHGLWMEVGPDFLQLFEHFDFSGKRVVDIGAGRTWSSRHLALAGGAAEVVAVDVLTTRFLGLETSDIFFNEDRIFFERVRADLHRIPLRDGWADVVFSCASLHHSSDLSAVYGEVSRVLRPGGHFIFLCEPCKKASVPEHQPQNEETAHGINEYVYSFSEYLGPLREAGFRCRQLAPRSVRQAYLYPRGTFREKIPKLLLPATRTELGRDLIEWAMGNRLIGPLLYRFWSLPLTVIAQKTRRAPRDRESATISQPEDLIRESSPDAERRA